MNNKKDEKTFWITNISNRDVGLFDLNVTIRAYSMVDLLGKRYQLTEAQLEKSFTSGSLFAKRDKLVKRVVEPVIDEKNKYQGFISEIPPIFSHKIEQDRQAAIPTRQRSVLEIQVKEYEELRLSNENSQDDLQAEFDAIAESADSPDELPPTKKGS